MLPACKKRELLLPYLPLQPPLLCELSVPLAAYYVAFRVVICLPVGEFLPVIPPGLGCTQWCRNSQHLVTRRMVLAKPRCPSPSQARSPASKTRPADSAALRYRLPSPQLTSHGQ